MPAKPAGPRDVATGGRLKPFLPLALLSTLLLPIDAATAVEPGAVEIGAIFSPVETGVGVEDHQARHQHDEDGERVDPMPQPRRKAMAVRDPGWCAIPRFRRLRFLDRRFKIHRRPRPNIALRGECW